MLSETPSIDAEVGSDSSGFDLSADRTADSDVAIVGAGLAGALAALMLSRRGLRVTLFDLHDAPAPEFRAEQLVGAQTGRLAELGVLSAMTQLSRLCPVAINSRFGKVMDRTQVDQYGVPYHRMVEAVRSALPPAVRRVTGRVAHLDATAERQTVTLSNGFIASARLLILATGLSTVLPKRLGITTTVLRPGHSLALGFDVSLANPASASLLPLIYYGEDVRQKMDYLALFPMEQILRANLFCYQERDAAWTRSFCHDPAGALQAAMPRLSRVIGPFSITSSVQIRSNDLRIACDPVRDGVVLIGDAFQTPCPAAGTGIDRLLSDLTVLCETHVPAWFASPGMGKRKIAAYYDDPAKRAFDAECLRIAEYRRAVSTQESLRWILHRQQVSLRRKLKAAIVGRLAKQRTLNTETMAPSL